MGTDTKRAYGTVTSVTVVKVDGKYVEGKACESEDKR